MSDTLVITLGAVIVAIVTAVPATISVLINRRHISRLNNTVGEANGNGDLMTMVTRVLSRQVDHEDSDREEFKKSRERYEDLNAILQDHLPLFKGLREELEELNSYSHESKHLLINRLTFLSGYVELIWNELHPDKPMNPPDDGNLTPVSTDNKEGP